MKIFITGSAGFIGQHLLEFYQERKLFAFTRHMNIDEELARFKPNIIINCAAEIYNAEFMWASNVQTTVSCLEYVKQSQTKMIQIGSSSEYGPMPRASAETDAINPIDMYQATKGAATILCQGYARQYELDIVIARPYSIYGKYEKPHRLFPRLCRAFKRNEPMKLYQGYHDFIYIDDFIRGIDLLVNKLNMQLGDIVNFGSGIQYSNFAVLEIFEQVTGHTAPVELVDTMAKNFENDVWICNTDYAEKQYGFKTKVDLKTGIEKLLTIE